MTMRKFVEAIEGEYGRYKSLAEAAVEQLSDDQLQIGLAGGNSVAIIVQHIAGNLKSRFTDFLTTDGEKPWRDRESEFTKPSTDRPTLLAQWEDGWQSVIAALAVLVDGDLDRTVAIRGVPLSVAQALQRSLAHTAYHVGQIVLVARGIRGADWRYLSIPPGQSAKYNANPTREKTPR
jgi:hypothetical protein